MQNSSRRTRTVAAVAVAVLATAALVLWNQRDADEPEDIPRTTSGPEVDAATRASESSHAAATGTAGEVAHELTERAGRFARGARAPASGSTRAGSVSAELPAQGRDRPLAVVEANREALA